MARVEIHLFGKLKVTLDGKDLNTFESVKVRALLAYLATESGGSHPREKLAGLLWPDWPQKSAMSNLRYALADLRKNIGDRQADRPFLLITRETIQFNLESDCWLDLVEFERQITCSDEEMLQSAMLLYRGPFLDGFTSGDSIFFDEWLALKREWLNRQALGILHDLADAHEERCEYDLALPFAWKQVEIDPWLEEAHQQLMRLLALNGQRSTALAQYEVCRKALKKELDVEPSLATKELLEAIRTEKLEGLAGLRAERHAPQVDLHPEPGELPFKGLQYFDTPDAALFFGREDLTARLVGHLREMAEASQAPLREDFGFLAVVGASGSGKSSVVRAGVVPALLSGQPLGDGSLPPEGSPGWHIHVFTPTAHPLEALAISLLGESKSVSDTARLMDDFGKDPRSLRIYTQRLLTHASPSQAGMCRLLLIIDQFEELFTLCRSEVEREAFLNNLLTAAQDGRLIQVIVVLRADFYGHCAQYPLLRQALCSRQEYIGPLDAAGIRQAIEEPAHRHNWEFEPGLVDLILRDVGASEDHPPEPGALPLLEHALLETWLRRNGRRLTLKGYSEAGGVHGAIAKTAGSVFARLNPEQQTLARRIFLRLTELGEGTQDTRRRAGLTELAFTDEDADQVTGLLKILADARLVTLSEDSAEVAHEALIREWPALRQWLNEDREGLRLQRRLTEVAEAWEALGRDAGELYRGARLAQALEWVAQPGRSHELNELEGEFLQASQAQSDREVREGEAQRQRELETARKLAENERQRAEESYARELGMAAYAGLSQDPERSILLGLQAAKTWQALGRLLPGDLLDTLRKALQASRVLQTWHSGGKMIGYVGFQSGNGHPIVVTEADEVGRVNLWDIADNQVLATFPGQVHYYTNLAVSPDGKVIAIPGEGDALNLWHIQTGQIWMMLCGHGGSVTGSAFSPDGRMLVSFSDSGQKAILWELPAAGRMGPAGQKRGEYPVTALDSFAIFSPDSKRLALIDPENAARVIDLSTGDGLQAGQEVAIFRADGKLQALAFSPDGKLLASAGLTGRVYAWEIETGKQVFLQKLKNTGEVEVIAFSRDGSWLTFGASVWETVTGWEKFALLGANQRVNQLALDGESARLITANSQDKVTVWSMTASRDVLTLELGNHKLFFADLAFSPDGRWLVSSNLAGNILVWDFPRLLEMGKQHQHNPGGAVLVKEFVSGHGDMINSLAFSPDGKWLATSSADRTVKLWDSESWQTVTTFSDPGPDLPMALPMFRGVTTVLFSPADGAGCLLAYSGISGSLTVRNIQSGEILLTYQEKAAAIKELAFSPDGKWLAFGTAGQPDVSDMGVVKVLDLASGQVLFESGGFASWIHGLAFSPDCKRLGIIEFVSGCIWDLETGEKHPLAGYPGGVAMAMSPDGSLMAASKMGLGLGIWDAVTGLPVSQLVEPGQIEGLEWNLRFSPDGRYLAACNTESTVRVYAVHPEDLLAEARARLTRTWRLDECNQYLHTDTIPPDPRLAP